MKKHLIIAVTSMVLSGSALAYDAGEATAQIASQSKIADISVMTEAQKAEYSQRILSLLKASTDKTAQVKTWLANNPDSAAIVYQLAMAAGVNESDVVAAAIEVGIDPSALTAPTAFVLNFVPPPPPPSPPPPPPPAPIGPCNQGGICISNN